ncbi:MAG: DUF4150 domain-containing protein [Pseudomonadota bacterium]
MVFQNTQAGGIKMGFPDVCLTPIPVPTPVPYPNLAMGVTAIPSQFKVLTMFMPNHNLSTTVPLSNGDNAGVNMGVASGMVMGPARELMGSVKVFECVMPVTKMLSPTLQNSTNAPGTNLAPSQVKVAVLI